MPRAIEKFRLFILFCFLFYALYLVYLVVLRGPVIYRHAANPRPWILEERVLRGGIFARGGEKLAESNYYGGKAIRSYPGGEAFAHVIGYESRRLGKTGLEEAFDSELLGLQGSLWKSLEVRWGVKGIKGNDLYLTLDAGLQNKAWEDLKPYRGAAVVLNPRNGEILAMVSTPSFDPDPDELDRNWNSIIKRPDHPLLNRAADGLYPPGSTMKLVTAATGLSRFPGLSGEVYQCQGFIKVHGRILNDLRVHGQVDLDQALKVSCNSYFASLGLRLGKDDFTSGLKAFGWGKPVPLEIPAADIPLPEQSLASANGLAESAIGQGEILVSPLFMAMVAGSIGNGGVMMKPHLVKEIRSPEGRLLWNAAPDVLRQVTTPDIAAKVTSAMVGVVRDGTGTAASLPGVTVAGKTGSAENPQGEPHAWFVAFAPAENPVVAVCVLVENGGQGGRVAAPIARDLLKMALAQGGL